MKVAVKNLALKQCIEALYTGGVVEWSADGSTLFSTCTNVVKAIRLNDGLSSYTIGDDDESLRITCICLDNNRGRLAVAYNNQIVREYVIPTSATNKPVVARMWKTMHEAPILVMRFNYDGSLLTTGSADHVVKVWDMNHQHCTHSFKGVGVVSAICFIRNDRLMVGYIDGHVYMFDLVKGANQKLLHQWKSHNSQVTGIVELPTSRRVVVVSRDQTASILESETKETLKVFPLFERVESAIMAHNGNLITVGEEGTIKEWLIDKARLVRKKTITSCRLDSVLYNPLCDQLITVSAEENLFILSFKDFVMKRQIVGFHDEVYSCCLLGKNESHMAVASNTSDIRLYDTSTWDCRIIEGHTESVLCLVSASWDRRLLASCSKDKSIILWKLTVPCENDDYHLLPIIHATGHTSSVNALCFSHSIKRPFLLSVSSDTTIKLWSLVDINLEGRYSVEESEKLSCSSTLVAHSKDVNCVDVALTDSICLTGGMDKMIKLWHIDPIKMQLGIAGSLSGHRRGVGDAKFAPNSLKVVSCSGDMTIKLWCLQDKSCLQTITGHNSAVFKVLFVNNGSQLVSADSAGIIKIWTLATGESDNSIDAHNNKIWSLCANSNESEYISAGSDGRIIIWKDISEGKVLEQENKIRKKIEEEQTLSNLLEQERYQDALEFALGLVRPYCALKVIENLIDRNELLPAISRLDQQKTQTILDFATQWNTNSRTSQASQYVLNCILMVHNPEDLLKLSNINTTVQSFIPYTKRHMERLNKARQDVSLLNFTWNKMRLN